MTDDQGRPDQGQADSSDTGTDALNRADVQEAQDKAGIAGEPQPTDTDPADDE